MEQQNKAGKKSYTAPRIVVLGDVEAITLGTSGGEFTDAAFPEMTPKRLLKFS